MTPELEEGEGNVTQAVKSDRAGILIVVCH
jgi:hypothetical protein